MPLQLRRPSNSKLLFILIGCIVFVEIIITSPRLLEKESTDTEAEAVSESDSAVAAVTDSKDTVEQKMRGVHLVENSAHEKGWELFAVEAVGTANSQWVVKKVKVQFFSENKSNYIVTGDLGEIDGNTKDMVIRGNVTTVSSNGYSFNTDSIRYVAKDKIMTSNDKVVMQGPSDKSGSGFKLTGERFLIDMVKNKMSILDHIVAKKTMRDKNFDLTSNRADFSNKSQEASFAGDVRMKLGTTFVKAPLALFIYSAVTKSLETITLSDKVEFTDADKKGFCKEIEFSLADNKMTMRGQPKVLQGEDEIKGHEIVFLDGGKKVKINKSDTQKQDKK